MLVYPRFGGILLTSRQDFEFNHNDGDTDSSADSDLPSVRDILEGEHKLAPRDTDLEAEVDTVSACTN